MWAITCPGEDGLALHQRPFCLLALDILPPDFRVKALEGEEDDEGGKRCQRTPEQYGQYIGVKPC
jgi:hypothetical protein